MERNNIGGFTAGSEMIFEKKSDRLCVPIAQKTVITELSDELTLPDYRPEIRRLLKLTVALPTPSPYISGNTAEFSGDAVYTVLYVGDDGKLASAEFTAVYDAEAELPELSAQNIVAFDELCAENIVGRVTAPRKLSIRCRLRHMIRAYGEIPTEAELIGDAEIGNTVRLTETYPSCFFAFSQDDDHEVKESIPVAPDARIISTDAVPFINDVRVKNGEAMLSGSLILSLLCDTEGGDPTVTERKIPFEATLPIDADGEGWEAMAKGTAAAITANIDEGMAECRVRLSLAVTAQKNVPAVVTKDIYATDRACNIEFEDMISPVCRYCANGNFTVSGTAELSGLPESYEIISSSANAEADELSTESGKYVLTGKCRLSALILGDGEYSNREFELPWRYEFGRAEGDADDYAAELSCPIVRVRGDKNGMTADAEICAALRVFENEKLTAVKSVAFGEPEDLGARPAYTVVYVSDGESLWDIAKRYSADPEAIAAANGLRITSPASSDTLSGVDFLII